MMGKRIDEFVKAWNNYWDPGFDQRLNDAAICIQAATCFALRDRNLLTRNEQALVKLLEESGYLRSKIQSECGVSLVLPAEHEGANRF